MKDIVQKKLEAYNCQNSDDEENAIREITQEIALYALMKADFFKYVAFQGGTCLRIMHGLDRFSEDLDFVLQAPDRNFKIAPFLDKAASIMKSYAFDIEVAGGTKDKTNVQKRFLKDDSIKKIVTFRHYTELNKKIKIKIECDINPPSGAVTEMAFCDFPMDFSVVAQNIPSLFAGKCHALLCRNYVKGRDWYDFLWYLRNGATVNYALLSQAVNQVGNWQDLGLTVDYHWLKLNLAKRISEVDWSTAINDVKKFLSSDKIETLALWETNFFLSKLEKLAGARGGR